jgi:Mg2+-importing ATPase
MKKQIIENLTKDLVKISELNNEKVLEIMNSNIDGLSIASVNKRIGRYGSNEIAKEKHKSPFIKFISNFKDPLVILLMVLGVVSYITGDIRATIMILVMIFLGVILRFLQENKADNAAQKLKAMVSNKTTVIRDKKEIDVHIKNIVPGDIIKLGAGDMIPADIRILSSKDLSINQSALTGESLPVDKHADAKNKDTDNLFEISNLCFLGSNVVSGIAIGIVINTGSRTHFGMLAKSVVNAQTITNFDKGIKSFSWLMIKFILIMTPIVFLVNGLSKGDWLEATLFAMAVAVGLTPEMLPMIVSVNLSKGAVMMSKKKVIVKRLDSIQNFGAMDILCTDKTGTITQGKIILERHLDVKGNSSLEVLKYGYLNSYFHTSLKNLLDDAILEHGEEEKILTDKNEYSKVDEVPFDFIRKRLSVVIENSGKKILICKGALEEVITCCDKVEIDSKIISMEEEHKKSIKSLANNLNNEGFREVAIAYKELNDNKRTYDTKDENDLILLGFLSFLDPPKETAKEALTRLNNLGVNVKILTGDNEVVTSYVCKEVNLKEQGILLGPDIEKMTDEKLQKVVEDIGIFARLAPNHKERIIKALKNNNHVVGFMGDGINDAPALKTADIGISVDSAVDIAKESSNIILLDNSLLVLEQGVIEGRRVFGNINKYIKMAASSNFGNMFSVIIASAFLPFLPLLPIQVLVNNLLYDFSQTTIPTDKVDNEWLKKPRKWEINSIKKFILLIGPISSIFDCITFIALIYLFNCLHNPELFHTGWFIVSICTQTIIIHIIRTKKIPFIQSRASTPLIISTFLIIALSILLTMSSFSDTLGFVKLPLLFWPFLIILIICYVILTQIVKNIYNKKYEY